MSIVYLLKNQHGQYLDKSGEWISGDNSRTLFRSVYKDEALNRKVEFSVKNFDLRISIFEASLNAKGDIELSKEDVSSGPAAAEEVFTLESNQSDHSLADESHSETEVAEHSQTQESLGHADEKEEQKTDANIANERTLIMEPDTVTKQRPPATPASEDLAAPEDTDRESADHLQAAH